MSLLLIEYSTGVYRVEELQSIIDQKLNYRAYMWEVLENPKSCLAGKIYGYLSLFMTILSVVLYIVEVWRPELTVVRKPANQSPRSWS